MEYVHLGRSGLSVSRLCLEDDVLKRLDDLFPGYRPAPEHYAW